MNLFYEYMYDEKKFEIFVWLRNVKKKATYEKQVRTGFIQNVIRLINSFFVSSHRLRLEGCLFFLKPLLFTWVSFISIFTICDSQHPAQFFAFNLNTTVFRIKNLKTMYYTTIVRRQALIECFFVWSVRHDSNLCFLCECKKSFACWSVSI